MKTKNADWVARLVASRIFGNADAWRIEEPVRVALQRLIDGNAGGPRDGGRPGGSVQDLGGVGYGLNVTWFRCRKMVDEVGMRRLEAAGQVLAACEARGSALGFYMLLTEEKESVCVGVNLFAEVLRESSLMQWADAEADFLRHCTESEASA